MSHHVFQARVQCGSCKGTGIYVGFAERDGAGIVCSTCKGTGCKELRIEYDDFEGRKRRSDIERVFETNPGFGISKKGPNGEYVELWRLGGIAYTEWFAGYEFTPGTEMRLVSCPAWFCQSAGREKRPDWKECVLGGAFAGCQYFPTMDQCWARWDKENLVQITSH